MASCLPCYESPGSLFSQVSGLVLKMQQSPLSFIDIDSVIKAKITGINGQLDQTSAGLCRTTQTSK
jgi:hypothetical protein